MSDFFFHTNQLTVGYNGKPLIRDIEIQLNRGQILTLIGPNGAGKSTILKSITKNLKAIHGAIYINGSSIDDISNKALASSVAVVLTEKPKTELMTCEDIVATGRYPYTGRLGILSDQDREAVHEAMDMVNAWPLREQDFSRTSDGQRQRILLARAICQQPEIIVLDEPTSFLDVRYELELLGILRTMAETKGIAVIMSLHELDMAQKVSDFVMCVKGEYITRYGTPQQIFRRDFIHELYELNGGTYNELFGSLEMERCNGAADTFVIAGGGSGIAEYRKLQRKRIPFITGILHENDVDYQVARDLAIETIAEQAFKRISDASFEAALARLKSCNTIINCLNKYGETNMRNKMLLEAAMSMGIAIYTSADEV